MQWLRLINLCIVALLAGHPAMAAPGPSTEPTPLQEQRQRADELAAQIQSRPFSGELNLSEALQLRQENSSLIVGTSIVATPRPRSFAVPDHGVCSALLRMNRASRPMLIQVDRLDTADPQATYVYTSLYAIPNKVMLVMERATSVSGSFIQLIDDRTEQRVSPTSQGECRLYVQISDAEDHPLTTLQLTALDFKTLVAEHRSIIDLYLRQALRELGQERILLPDAFEARQALTSSEPPSDPKVHHEIEQFVARLDSASWGERFVAMQSLQRLGEPALQSLQSMKRQGLTITQCNAVDDVIDSAWPLQQATAKRLGTDLAFVIDCLDSDEPSLRQLVRRRLEKLTGQATPPQLLSADAATRSQAIDSLRAKWLVATTEPSAARQPVGTLAPFDNARLRPFP